MTVADLVVRFATEGVGHLKPRNRGYSLARLHNHILPLIGSTRISLVRVTDIETTIGAICDRKTARDVTTGCRARVIVRGGDAAASGTVRDFSAVFSFANHRELVSHNPTSQVEKSPIQRRTRFLSQDELLRFGNALTALDAQGAGPEAIAIMRL